MDSRRWRLRLALVTTLLMSAPLLANEATLRRDASLTEAPKPGATVVADLVAGDAVSVKQRKGLWAEACQAQLCGWIRVTSLAMARSGSTTSSSLAGLKSGREGAGNAVSSTGVRGLDATSIELSKPDYTALAALESGQCPRLVLAILRPSLTLNSDHWHYSLPPKFQKCQLTQRLRPAGRPRHQYRKNQSPTQKRMPTMMIGDPRKLWSNVLKM